MAEPSTHFDQARLEELREVDDGKLLKIIFNYLHDDLVQAAEKLADLSPQRDAEAIGFLAHSILGAALQAGARPLADAACKLEVAALADDLSWESLADFLKIALEVRIEASNYHFMLDN